MINITITENVKIRNLEITTQKLKKLRKTIKKVNRLFEDFNEMEVVIEIDSLGAVRILECNNCLAKNSFTMHIKERFNKKN